MKEELGWIGTKKKGHYYRRKTINKSNLKFYQITIICHFAISIKKNQFFIN